MMLAKMGKATNAGSLGIMQPADSAMLIALDPLQGDIFNYLLAVIPEFGLSLYQQPSGNDLRAGMLLAVLGASHLPEPEKSMI
jgi:hypothetical protein